MSRRGLSLFLSSHGVVPLSRCSKMVVSRTRVARSCDQLAARVFLMAWGTFAWNERKGRERKTKSGLLRGVAAISIRTGEKQQES